MDTGEHRAFGIASFVVFLACVAMPRVGAWTDPSILMELVPGPVGLVLGILLPSVCGGLLHLALALTIRVMQPRPDEPKPNAGNSQVVEACTFWGVSTLLFAVCAALPRMIAWVEINTWNGSEPLGMLGFLIGILVAPFLCVFLQYGLVRAMCMLERR